MVYSSKKIKKFSKVNNNKNIPNPMFYLSARSKPIAQSAKGIYITADDGKSYMDAASGAIVCQLGHSHPKIIEAIKNRSRNYNFLIVPFEISQPLI